MVHEGIKKKGESVKQGGTRMEGFQCQQPMGCQDRGKCTEGVSRMVKLL